MTKQPMTREQATALVIRELGAHRKRNDIVMALCERMGLSWPEAEKFIRQVEASNKRAITVQQSPFMMVISVVLLILGFGGILYGVQYVMNNIDFLQRDFVSQLFSLHSGYFAVGGLFTGLGMFGGGLYGLGRTVVNLFRDE